MKLANIFEGKAKTLSALDKGGARFIVKRVTASLEKEGKPVSSEAIIKRIKYLGTGSGWSQEVKDHAIQLVKDQG